MAEISTEKLSRPFKANLLAIFLIFLQSVSFVFSLTRQLNKARAYSGITSQVSRLASLSAKKRQHAFEGKRERAISTRYIMARNRLEAAPASIAVEEKLQIVEYFWSNQEGLDIHVLSTNTAAVPNSAPVRKKVFDQRASAMVDDIRGASAVDASAFMTSVEGQRQTAKDLPLSNGEEGRFVVDGELEGFPNGSRRRFERILDRIFDIFTSTFGEEAKRERQLQSKRRKDGSDTVAKKKFPPILFIHGSFHGGWCFAENFFSYFSKRGHNCYAVSLRGTSTTGLPQTDVVRKKAPSSIAVETHVDDMKFVLKTMEGVENGARPIIIAHSFGGLILMKLLEDEDVRCSISGAALLCSVPPSGNGPMTSRFIQRRFFAALNIVCGFVFKAAATNLQLCRKLFFDESVDSEDIYRYMRNFQADSRIGIDIDSVIQSLPSRRATEDGRADWLLTRNQTALEQVQPDQASNTTIEVAEKSVPQYTIPSFPILVCGAGNDYIVDDEGTIETARFLGVDAKLLPGMYHDLMLGPRWTQAALAIDQWMQLHNL